jgi:hypothetical protein
MSDVIGNERCDRPVQVATASETFPKRGQSILPFLHAAFRCQAMFDESSCPSGLTTRRISARTAATILQTFAAQRIERQKALDITTFIKTALPLLHFQVTVRTASHIQGSRGS